MIKRFLLVAFLSLWSIAGFAQSEKYIFHDVVQGDTKYSISQKYNVSIEDLEKFNPEIKNGLRVNTKLLIPKELMQKDEKPAPARTVGPGFTTYKVKVGETLYSIAKEHEVSIADIRKNNPQLADGLKAGMELSIPPKGIKETQPEKKEDTGDKTHTVQQGETLYSLAIKYHVGVADIKKANPQLEEDGLKTGMVLNIPEPREEVKEEIAIREAQKAYYVHVVKKTETAYSLSRKYEITLDSLYILNPKATDGLRIGQELNFPANRAPKDSLVVKPKTEKGEGKADNVASVNDSSAGSGENDNYFLYKVKSGDSFYSLKTRYNVDQEELQKLNPELKRGLEVDKYIIIPQKGQQEDVKWLDKLFAGGEDSPSGSTGSPSDRQKQQKDRLNTDGKVEVVTPTPEFKDSLKVNVSKTYTVGLMLPFEVQADSVSQSLSKVDGTQKISLDFYNGFVMAADTLVKQGLNLNLNVYDTRKSLTHLQQKGGEFRRMNFDMVVGPLFQQNVEYIADELRKQNVPVISPLSKTVDVNGRPNLVKCNADEGATGHKIADILNKKYQHAQVIFAYSKGNEKDVREVKARLLPRADGSFIDNVSFSEEMIERQTLEATLDPDTQNVVVIFSEDPVFLSDLISKLRMMRKYNIAVIGPSKLLKIQTLEMDYLNRLNLSMPDGNFIDYSDEYTISFIEQYREKYKGEPSQFAFQGYDVGMYFLQKLWKTGPYLLQSLNDEQALLGTGFHLEKEPKGGYTNQFMYLTGIRELTLVKLEEK